MVLTSLLFGVVGWYLTLIAKFYRQKFSKGPPHQYLQAALGVLIAGLLLTTVLAFRAQPAHGFAHYLASILICAGGLGFSGLCYALYRTMMSVD
jgi:H+/Cl- antiporter ClcA